MSGNEVAQVPSVDAALQEFTKKIERRVRDEVSQSIPDSVIDAMVAQTTQRLFFTPSKVRNPDYNRYGGSYQNDQYIDGPSHFEKLVAEAAKPLLEQAVKDTLVARHAEIAAAIQRAVDSGLATIFYRVLSEAIVGVIVPHGQDLGDMVIERLRQRGLQIG